MGASNQRTVEPASISKIMKTQPLYIPFSTVTMFLCYLLLLLKSLLLFQQFADVHRPGGRGGGDCGDGRLVTHDGSLLLRGRGGAGARRALSGAGLQRTGRLRQVRLRLHRGHGRSPRSRRRQHIRT